MSTVDLAVFNRIKQMTDKMNLSVSERATLWVRVTDHSALLKDCTEEDLLAMTKPTWSLLSLLQKSPPAKQKSWATVVFDSKKKRSKLVKTLVKKYPFISETSWVKPEKAHLLPKMSTALVVFEAKLELSVLNDAAQVKLRELFDGSPDLFDPNVDYNVHQIAATHFPAKRDAGASAFQLFVEEKRGVCDDINVLKMFWEATPDSSKKRYLKQAVSNSLHGTIKSSPDVGNS